MNWVSYPQGVSIEPAHCQRSQASEEAIQDLGVCAMFHDMGYAAREGADQANGEHGYAPPYERHASAGAQCF